MSDSVTLNRAASIIDQVTPEFPADAALREALSGNHELSAAEKRTAARAVFVYREAVVQREVDPQRADRLRERELAVVPSASIAQWDAPRGDAVERARAELHRDAEDEADPSMARAEEGGRPR